MRIGHLWWEWIGQYGQRTTVYNRCLRWSEHSAWCRKFTVFAAEGKNALIHAETAEIKVRHWGTGSKEEQDQNIVVGEAYLIDWVYILKACILVMQIAFVIIRRSELIIKTNKLGCVKAHCKYVRASIFILCILRCAFTIMFK